jgi:hypothetical protein
VSTIHSDRLLFNDFKSLSLAEAEAVSIMDRVDSKFLFNEVLLNQILNAVVDDYNVLEVECRRINN